MRAVAIARAIARERISNVCAQNKKIFGRMNVRETDFVCKHAKIGGSLFVCLVSDDLII